VPTATFTTGKGAINLSVTNLSMIQHWFEDILDYDDQTRFGLAEFMMTAGESTEVDTPEFFAWAAELNPRTGTLNNGTVAIATDTTNIIVTSISGIRVDDILHVGTADADGEHLRVTAIGTNNVTVARINTTPATINTSATYIILGSASSELATAGITATFMEPDKVTNRCQLIRRAFQLSETEDATNVRVQTRYKQKAEQARMDFRLDLAHTFWFSISTVDTTNTYWTTKGINEQLSGNAAANKIDENGALAMATLSSAMEAVAPYSKSSDYACFVGSKALSGLADLGQTASIGAQEVIAKLYGSAAQTVAVGDFRFAFKYERLFDIIGAPYSGYIYLLDLKALGLYHMAGRKFIFQSNTKADPLSEIVTSQYKAHVGVGINWAKRHAFIYGVT
jgi:hypothetical protein